MADDKNKPQGEDAQPGNRDPNRQDGQQGEGSDRNNPGQGQGQKGQNPDQKQQQRT